MTAIPMNYSQTETPAHFHVWRCEGCHCFHVRAADVLLTFTPAEFAAFSNLVSECYWQEGIRGLLNEGTPPELFAVTPDAETLN